MSNDYVYVVIATYGDPQRESIEGVYADGITALGYEAGRVAWTRSDEYDENTVFYGKPVHPGGGDTYRIEKWQVER
jgi:hypothetical protein